MKPHWYTGLPPAEVVAAHETDHARADGVRLGDISVSVEQSNGQFSHAYIRCNPDSYGNWIVFYPATAFGPRSETTSLKVVNGVVYEAIGHTQWHPLSNKLERWKWARGARYFPVGDDGLPQDYEAKGD